jgi:rRNA maturation endonuclease Nob1
MHNYFRNGLLIDLNKISALSMIVLLKYSAVYNIIETMVELRCHNCKRVFQFARQPEDDKFYTKCPQCNSQVQIARPRNYGSNNPQIHNKK